ncbi:uncharacterized protein LOC142975306 isoform X1 [Anticarsia gemmatalis]|uniref:uncharacterized protein LOC142975306 isoform X1 n=1 Tax=Anticarsia gemmatalis TaxID=129554 RepID=UPI003F76C174
MQIVGHLARLPRVVCWACFIDADVRQIVSTLCAGRQPHNAQLSGDVSCASTAHCQHRSLSSVERRADNTWRQLTREQVVAGAERRGLAAGCVPAYRDAARTPRRASGTPRDLPRRTAPHRSAPHRVAYLTPVLHYLLYDSTDSKLQ